MPPAKPEFAPMTGKADCAREIDASRGMKGLGLAQIPGPVAAEPARAGKLARVQDSFAPAVRGVFCLLSQPDAEAARVHRSCEGPLGLRQRGSPRVRAKPQRTERLRRPISGLCPAAPWSARCPA